jgi:hypothetical protein
MVIDSKNALPLTQIYLKDTVPGDHFTRFAICKGSVIED